MGSVQSQEVASSHSPTNADPRSPCLQITRTPVQVVVDKNDPRSPSTAIMRTPIDKCSQHTPDENQGERCPLLKHAVPVEKKSLLKEFNN